jgi:hypothetical protein
MFMFGHVEDLLKFWNGRLDLRELPERGGFSRSYALERNVEVFLTTNFLEHCGETLNWTLSDYWNSLAKRFIIVDSGFLDLHWPKYSSIENRWSWNGEKKTTEVSFAMWLGMLEGSLEAEENLLNALD